MTGTAGCRKAVARRAAACYDYDAESILWEVMMFGSAKSRNVGLASMLLLAACTTSPRDIETPTGPVPGMITGRFVILGVADRATAAPNQPNGAAHFVETVDIDVPVGTEVILPALRGFDIGYGSTDPADLSPMPLPESTFSWRHEDHHFGVARVNVAVVDIDAAAPGASPQHARIQVGLRPNDDNGDDKWWGVVRYQLIFLGRATP
jgi:hypothetical protein